MRNSAKRTASAVVGTVAVDAPAACSDVTLPQSPPTSPSAKRPVVPCMMDRAVSLRLRVDGPMCALPARAPVLVTARAKADVNMPAP